jgi:hypothetical protein
VNATVTLLVADDASDLADLLSVLEDWLLHADEDVLDALASFGFRACYRPRQAVRTLIDDLGHHGAGLRRQLHALAAEQGGAR